jgi:predicted nuclease of predicted toxin-antitoxin system
MKILLDESLPGKLRQVFLVEHEVLTVRDKNWLGQKNGVLLKLLVEDGFELFVTVDRNLRYQQNTESLPITVVILCAVNNRFETLEVLIPKMFKRLAERNRQNIIEVS